MKKYLCIYFPLSRMTIDSIPENTPYDKGLLH